MVNLKVKKFILYKVNIFTNNAEKSEGKPDDS